MTPRGNLQGRKGWYPITTTVSRPPRRWSLQIRDGEWTLSPWLGTGSFVDPDWQVFVFSHFLSWITPTCCSYYSLWTSGTEDEDTCSLKDDGISFLRSACGSDSVLTITTRHIKHCFQLLKRHVTTLVGSGLQGIPETWRQYRTFTKSLQLTYI